VDQPFGTGFSLTPKEGIPKTVKDATVHFVGFLKGFLSIFSNYSNHEVECLFLFF
jgi:carboxypeptidase C (cathepsin A)